MKKYTLVGFLTAMTLTALLFQNCTNSGFIANSPLSSSAIPLGANQCLHPDQNIPVNNGETYSYYTLGMGSESECAASAQVAICDGASQSFGSLPSQRFSRCSVLISPPVSGGDQNNRMTIKNVSTQTASQYPLQIGRAFRKGEIANYPALILNGQTLPTQADVKNRYDDGSVKFAVISAILPQLKANEAQTITFANQASGLNQAVNPTELLTSTMNFDARMMLTSGATNHTLSARKMIENGHFRAWTSGPIATTLILADHSSARTYDVGFGTYRPFRPLFHVTFWPTLNQYRVRYIGEVINSEELANISYDLSLSVGNTSPQVVYRQSGITQHVGSRWSKVFWSDTPPEPKVNLDHNLAYLKLTRFFPNYDTSIAISESTLANAAKNFWESRDQSLFSPGPWNKAMGTAGGRPDIGPYPNWTVYWMYTGDWRLRDAALGAAELAAGWPLHYREGNPQKRFLRSDTTPGTGLGKVISLTDRKTTALFSGLDYSYTKSEDRLVVVGAKDSHGWTPDGAHQPDPFSPQYTLTGDYFFLEQMYMWAGVSAHFYNGAANTLSYGRGPTGAEGGIRDQVRGNGWVLRNRAQTAFLAPDADPEKTYFTQLVKDALALWEGQRSLTQSPYKDNPNWTWGQSFKGSGYTDGQVSTLGFFENNTSSSIIDSLHNNLCTPGTINSFTSPWMQHFMAYGVGRAGELGFNVSAFEAWESQFRIGMFTSPDVFPQMVGIYQIPASKVTGQFTSWADFRSVFSPTALQSSVNQIQANLDSKNIDLDHSYMLAATIALTYQKKYPNGNLAWAWAYTNVYSRAPFELNPKWAILPRD